MKSEEPSLGPSHPSLRRQSGWPTSESIMPGLWGIEAEHLSVASHNRLKASCRAMFRLRRCASAHRTRADGERPEDEITSIRASGCSGAGLFDSLRARQFVPACRKSRSPRNMEYAARRRGPRACRFEPIIASGERSALPHGRASRSRSRATGFVVCDFGVILGGYCSDMTRTVYVGVLPAEARAFTRRFWMRSGQRSRR